MTTAEDMEGATMTTKREEWTVNEATGEVWCDGLRTVADVTLLRDARRIAAVPDMEAALMALLPEGLTLAKNRERHTAACWKSDADAECLPDCADARAALRKAGRL